MEEFDSACLLDLSLQAWDPAEIPELICLEAFLVTFLRVGRVGQVVKDVESGSPAEAAGLKNDDLVVAVNGESVEALDHDGVVEMIKKGGEQTTLLVLDKEADSIYRLVS